MSLLISRFDGDLRSEVLGTASNLNIRTPAFQVTFERLFKSFAFVSNTYGGNDWLCP